MDRPHVVVVHTGGTLGMRHGPEGYAPEPGHLERLLAERPELHRVEMPTFTLVEHDPLLDSAAMRPEHWQRIADTIVAHAEDAHGFVVLHGTDTMAYTASALSFLLEGLDRPVVMTGSQIPLEAVRSDGHANLIASLLLAARGAPAEVTVFAGDRLLRGNRATKVSASGFEAFVSPNHPALGHAGVALQVEDALARPPGPGPLRAARLRNAQVLALRLFPGIGADTLRNVLDEPVEGMVLEAYGSGNGPTDPDLLEVLRAASERGVVVVATSQCLRGRVDMGAYATGSGLARAGVVSGGDMTAEAALAKLLYLLSQGGGADAVRTGLRRDLRGELSEDGVSAPAVPT